MLQRCASIWEYGYYYFRRGQCIVEEDRIKEGMTVHTTFISHSSSFVECVI